MNVRDNSSSGQSLTPTGVGLFRPADEQQLHTSSFVKGVEIDDLDRLQRRAGKHANDLLAAPGALLVPLVDLPPPPPRPSPPPHPRVPDPRARTERRRDLQMEVFPLGQKRLVHAPHSRIDLRIVDVEDEE